MGKAVQFIVAGASLMMTACGSGDRGSVVAPSAPSAALPTLAVTGYVDDTTFRPVSGATVEVIDGAQAGLSTRTDDTGKFSFNAAIVSMSRLRATKDGYQPAIQALQVPANAVSRVGPMTFFLATDQPSGNSATLTVEADPACAALPSAARSRTYAATVTANSFSTPPNTTFFVNLDGASLDGYFRSVFVHAVDGVIMFDLSDNGIEEEIAPEAYLFVGGVGSTLAPPVATTISAPLTTGFIDYCVVNSDPGAAYPCTDAALVRVQCRSPNNRMTLKWR